jgi:hypothetical protein
VLGRAEIYINIDDQFFIGKGWMMLMVWLSSLFNAVVIPKYLIHLEIALGR